MHATLSPMRALAYVLLSGTGAVSGRGCSCFFRRRGHARRFDRRFTSPPRSSAAAALAAGGTTSLRTRRRSSDAPPGVSSVEFRRSGSRFVGGGRAGTSAALRFSSSSSVSSSSRPPSLLDEAKVVDDMLGRIRRCNRTPEEVKHDLLDFVVDGKVLGKATRKVARLLCSESGGGNEPIFRLASGAGGGRRTRGEEEVLTLTSAAGGTPDSRTDAVMSVMERLRSRGYIDGWRDELYPVSEGFYEEPTFLVERAAAPFLGAIEYGVHVNGLVLDDDDNGDGGDGVVRMWMARRSATKSKFPGFLDHIVAGGQPAGLGLMENVIKECEEEAGVPASLSAERAAPAGAISYETFTPTKSPIDDDDDDVDGVLNRVVLFNYDLVLPAEFEPTPVDGEVDEFFLWTIDEVKQSMALDYPDPIKPNCYLVIIDYLLRAGHVSPETPGYLDVLRELRSGSCC